MSVATAAVDAAFRAEWGSVVATLIRRTGDWDLAEECAAEAFARALTVWEREGVPRRPGAWLTTVAGNRAVDRLRRARRGDELLDEVSRGVCGHAGPERAGDDDEQEIEDDRLRLLFTCCHPALGLEARVALTLRALAGLSTAQIARAFLVTEPAMARRLTRAKAKIAAARIPYRVPPAELLAERTSGVLAVIYLTFTEGYAAGGERRLCVEAIALGRALTTMLPGEPEAAGLLALMLLQHARRDARLDADGEIVTLEDQDRGRWHQAEIEEGTALLTATLRRGVVGPYQLQAAIAACHVEPGGPDWAQIAALYGLLEAVHATPVVALNHAVAVAMAGDLERGLAAVDALAASLSGYHLLHATRADLLRRRGDAAGARAAYAQALELAPSEPERRFLRRRLATL